MSSGEKNLVYNTRERLVSLDFNRQQQFIARSRAQLLRALYNDARQNTYVYPGVVTPYVGGETPLAGDVYGGLMVDPLTTSVLVQPGQLGCLFPDPDLPVGQSAADDSPYMVIDDPGQQTAGILTFTANASGQIRVDLVECQPIHVTLETDNRDIYDPPTESFSPALVDKVRTYRLQYRIRTGTAGAGVPALAAGWLPLAAIVVPSGAADYSTCDFYDVRPLVEERVRPQPVSTNQYSPVRDAEYYGVVSGSDLLIKGYSETQFGGYVAGGWLRRSSPSFTGSFTGTGNNDGDPDLFTVTNAENQVAGLTTTTGTITYLVAFFPGGLPRWVRYSHSAAGGGLGRVPKGPRGVLLVTTSVPNRNGVYSSMAIGHGLGNATGVVLGTVVADAVSGTGFGLIAANNGEHALQSTTLCALSVIGVSPTVIDFPLVSGTHYPKNATEILCRLNLLLDNPVAALALASITITTFAGSSAGRLIESNKPLIVRASASGSAHFTTLRIPLLSRESPVNAAVNDVTVRVTYSASAGDEIHVGGATASVLSVYAWKLGS